MKFLIKKLAIISIANIFICGAAFSQIIESRGTRDGGDPRIRRMNSIEDFITGPMSAYLRVYFHKKDPKTIGSRKNRRIFQRIKGSDLVSEINSKNYSPTRTRDCIDENGVSQPATSIRGDVDGQICFDLAKLASIDSSKLELLALAAHEHAHHFGFADQDHDFYEMVYDDILNIVGGAFVEELEMDHEVLQYYCHAEKVETAISPIVAIMNFQYKELTKSKRKFDLQKLLSIVDFERATTYGELLERILSENYVRDFFDDYQDLTWLQNMVRFSFKEDESITDQISDCKNIQSIMD